MENEGWGYIRRVGLQIKHGWNWRLHVIFEIKRASLILGRGKLENILLVKQIMSLHIFNWMVLCYVQFCFLLLFFCSFVVVVVVVVLPECV